MTGWSAVFLGIIAFATFTMAAIQVAIIVYGWTVVRRVQRVVAQVESQVRPVVDNLNAVSRDVARVSALAVGQAERMDRLVTDLSTRIEQTATTVEDTLLKPLRNGAALLAGVKAAMEVFRGLTKRSGASRGRSDGEDVLFIG